MRNKKGSLTDGLFLIIALFVIAIVFLFSWKLMNDINNNMQGSPAISDNGKVLVQESTDKLVNILDQSFLWLFVGLVMAIVIGAYFIKTHPALFWFSVPIIVFIVFLGALYANIFHDISATPELISYASDFRFMTFIWDHFILFFVGIILLLSLALYAKNPEVQE